MDRSGEAGGAGGLTVLLADDHEDYRFLVRRLLERHGGFTVVGEASTGAEAVALVRDLRPAVAVLDLAMPDLDGLRAATAIREASPSTAIVVLSNFGPGRLADPALAAGAFAYVQKIDRDDLIPAILAAVAGTTGAVPGDAGGSARLGAGAASGAGAGGGGAGGGGAGGRAGARAGGAAASPDEAVQPLRWILPGDHRAPRAARNLVSGQLDDLALRCEPDEVLLLVSELVTNAIVHARSDVELVLIPGPTVLRVEVHDRDPRRVEPLGWTDDKEQGRGVALVNALSSRWGIDDADTGKVIWFEVDCPA